MLCKSCKKEISEGSKFCKYCGKTVEKDSENSFCISCGKQIKSSSSFCKHCGASMIKSKIVRKKNNNYNKKLAIKVTAVASLIIVGLLLFPHNKKSLNNNQNNNTYNGAITGTTKQKSNITEPKQKNSLFNNDCFVCGGDGKKDCTSCDRGYYIEYETGTYLGYGPTTREVRKKCKVCNGSGEVKCYH